ncbi:MAG: hypothetical protein FJ090_09895, partial [Deltaproteobacteria bacterium]|nr:hypothetical protein [Deltaproteobacteria bacterium]
SAPGASAGARGTPKASIGEPSASTIVSAIKSRRVPILAATGAVASLAFLGGMLVVGGAGAWWYFAKGASAGAPAVVASPAGSAQPASVEPSGVRVTTVPPGAHLWHESTDLGPSPLDLVVPEGQTWTLTARAPGFSDTDFDLRWDSERQQVVLKPAPVEVSAPPTPSSGSSSARPRAGSKSSSTTATATGPAVVPAADPPARDATETQPPETSRKPGSDLRDPWDN